MLEEEITKPEPRNYTSRLRDHAESGAAPPKGPPPNAPQPATGAKAFKFHNLKLRLTHKISNIEYVCIFQS